MTAEEKWSGREDLNLRPPGPEPGGERYTAYEVAYEAGWLESVISCALAKLEGALGNVESDPYLPCEEFNGLPGATPVERRRIFSRLRRAHNRDSRDALAMIVEAVAADLRAALGKFGADLPDEYDRWRTFSDARSLTSRVRRLELSQEAGK